MERISVERFAEHDRPLRTPLVAGDPRRRHHFLAAGGGVMVAMAGEGDYAQVKRSERSPHDMPAPPLEPFSDKITKAIYVYGDPKGRPFAPRRGPRAS